MKKNLRTKFVGMDVHQKTISIVIADAGPDGEVRLYGKIKNTVEAIEKVISTQGRDFQQYFDNTQSELVAEIRALNHRQNTLELGLAQVSDVQKKLVIE